MWGEFQEVAVWPSGEEEKKKTLIFSLGLVPIDLYSKVDVACKKNGVLDYSCYD